MLPPSIRLAATAASTILLALPANALAAPGSDATNGEQTPLNLPSEPQKLDVGGGGGSLVRTFVGLAIVIAVIYGIAWVLKQMKASREERSRGQGLSSAAVLALAPGRSLHLVRAGRELVLVGVADHGVTPIRTYTEAEAEELGLLGDEADDDAAGGSGGPGGRIGRTGTPPLSAFAEALRQKTDALREKTVRK